MAEASMVSVMKFFDIKTAVFRAEWNQLTQLDKDQLKAGIATGTLTY